MMSIRCITGDLHCELGEGPIYDERTDTLYFVDINRSTVYAVSAPTEASVTSGARAVFVCPDAEPASCVFLTGEPSKLVVGTTRHLRLVDLADAVDGETPTSEIIATLPDSIGATDEGARFNDGKVTPDGTHAIIGHLSLSWRNGPMGSLSSFDAKSGTFQDITPSPQGIGCPNGIVWRNGMFVIVDSRDESVRAYAANKHGVPEPTANRLVRQSDTKHANVPDGMALDSEGNLWIAVGESGEVRCYDGATGEHLRSVALPVKRPTSCNFGGKDLDVLFVTSRVEKAGDGQSAQHGGVFMIEGLGVKGAGYDGKLAL